MADDAGPRWAAFSDDLETLEADDPTGRLRHQATRDRIAVRIAVMQVISAEQLAKSLTRATYLLATVTLALVAVTVALVIVA